MFGFKLGQIGSYFYCVVTCSWLYLQWGSKSPIDTNTFLSSFRYFLDIPRYLSQRAHEQNLFADFFHCLYMNSTFIILLLSFPPFIFPYNTWISWYPGSLSLKEWFSLRFMSLKQIFLSIKQITHCLKPMLRVFNQFSSKHDLVGYLGNLCKINS